MSLEFEDERSFYVHASEEERDALMRGRRESQ